MTADRDVRLSELELEVIAEALRRDRRRLEKSIAADSGTYHRELKGKRLELEGVLSAGAAIAAALEVLNRARILELERSIGGDR